MRKFFVFLVASTVLLVVGCSGDDEDPVPAACDNACNVASSHPCARKTNALGETTVEECKTKCKALAAQAEAKWLSGCGVCIASTFGYATKKDAPCDKDPSNPVCCYGVSFESATDKTCLSKCFEPDGGYAGW